MYYKGTFWPSSRRSRRSCRKEIPKTWWIYHKDWEGTTIPKAKNNVAQVEAQASIRVKELEDGIEKAYQHEKYLIELLRKTTKETVGELKSELQTINQHLYQFKSESDTYVEDLKCAISKVNARRPRKQRMIYWLLMLSTVLIN